MLKYNEIGWWRKQALRAWQFIGVIPIALYINGGICKTFKLYFEAWFFYGLSGIKSETKKYINLKNNVHKHVTNQSNVKYLIMASDYVNNSAGVWCLYKLCNDLNEKKMMSFICGSRVTCDYLDAPILPMSEAKKLVRNVDNLVVVYPETVHGNPLNAKRVVRWVLNRPGLIDGQEIYNDKELIFLYAEAYRSYVKNEIAAKLYMPTIDESIFFNDNNDSCRKLKCFYVGKSRFKPGYFDPRYAVEITRNFPSRKDLGNLFRASTVLYCFDNSTIMVYEAIACGCSVMIIPDGTQTLEDFQCQELGMDGIMWGSSDSSVNVVDVDKFKSKYDDLKNSYSEMLNNFIMITQSHKWD